MPESGSKKPRVTFFYRKPRSLGNYSVEFIFKDVANRLKEYIRPRASVSRYESAGVFKRLYNCFEAVFRQGDVNHVTGDVNFLGILLKKRKTVQTILDCVHLHRSTGLKHKVIRFFWVSLPIKRCRYVTAISTSTKEEILKYVPCDPEKIVVVPVAISTAFTRSEKSFNKERPRILQVGTAPNKNIERLAMALRGIPCTLVVVGRPNKIYKEKIKNNGIDLEWLSGLSDEEMIQQYELADILVLASTYEGFGMPILEAQTVGRPVLTSNISSMPEVAGDAACLVDPHQVPEIREGILKIIGDDAYRNGLVSKGFENIRRFDPEIIAMQYLELYRKITDRK